MRLRWNLKRQKKKTQRRILLNSHLLSCVEFLPFLKHTPCWQANAGNCLWERSHKQQLRKMFPINIQALAWKCRRGKNEETRQRQLSAEEILTSGQTPRSHHGICFSSTGRCLFCPVRNPQAPFSNVLLALCWGCLCTCLSDLGA